MVDTPTYLFAASFRHMTYDSMRIGLFSIVTGHYGLLRPLASCWGREASRRLWVIHTIRYQLDGVTMAALVCLNPTCYTYGRKQNAIQQQNDIHQGAVSHGIRLAKSLDSKTIAHFYMRTYKSLNVLSRYWVEDSDCALGANSLSKVDRSALPLSRPNFESSLTDYSGSRFKTSMAFGGPVVGLGMHACIGHQDAEEAEEQRSNPGYIALPRTLCAPYQMPKRLMGG